MSDWEFDDMGEFGSESAAHRWADRNGLDPSDVHVRRCRGGVQLKVRRSALGDGSRNHNDLRDGRRSGW